MMEKMLLNTRVASAIIDHIYEDNLPITIHTGIREDDMIQVLVECDDETIFGHLLDSTINEVF